MKHKNIIATVAIIAAAVACTKEKSPYEPIGGEAISIYASETEIILSEEKGKDTAVTFTWSKGHDYTEAVSVEYCFKIDVADNNFSTATELEVLGPDVFEKSITVEELNDLCIEKWGITPGESVMLEAKVIARLTADKFIMPEVAVTSVWVTTYTIPSSPLYILGSAVLECNGGQSPSDAVLMTEEVPSRQYSYKGEFIPGEFIFIEQQTSIFPAWFSTGDGTGMEYRTETEGEGAKFSITKEATYKIVVNKRQKTLTMIYYPEYENIWMVGEASPGGWEISDATALTWIEGTGKFVYEGYLKAGDFKFAAGEPSWDSPFYMAMSENNSDLTITSMQLVEPGGVDYKWVITESNAGNWRITLDIDSLTILFEKI